MNHISERSVWLDEGLTIAFIRTPLDFFHRALAYDVHPPLYYWALRLWMLPQFSITWGRIFSAVCSLLTLPLLYFVFRRMTRTKTAFLATLLMAVSPQAIHYAQELRMYALQGLLAAAMMLSALWTFERRTWRSILLTTLLGTLLLYTHYFSGVFMVGFFCVLPFLQIQSSSPVGVRASALLVSPLIRTAVAALFCVLLYLPWLSTGLSHLLLNSEGGLYAGAPAGLTLDALRTQAIEALLGLVPAFPNLPVSITLCMMYVAVVIILAIIGILYLRKHPTAILFAISFLIIPLSLALLFQALGGRFYPRFYLPLLPALFFFVAVGFEAACPPQDKGLNGNSKQRMTLPAGIVFVLIFMPLLTSSMALTRLDLREVTHEASAILSHNAAPHTPILHATAHTFWSLRAYDAHPSRHRLMHSPDMPALPRLLYGRHCLATSRDLAQWPELWVAYGEWRFGPPTFRAKLEPLWFAQWTLASPPTLLPPYPFIKKIELAKYRRQPPGT